MSWILAGFVCIAESIVHYANEGMAEIIVIDPAVSREQDLELAWSEREFKVEECIY